MIHDTYIMITSLFHPDIVKLPEEMLQHKVESDEITELTPTPTEVQARLQFIPSHTKHEMSTKFTGCLWAKCAVQTRTLIKKYDDQHQVNVIPGNSLESIVGLRDKAKIHSGDVFSMSIGVDVNNKGIVSTWGDRSMQALDRGFHLSISQCHPML